MPGAPGASGSAPAAGGPDAAPPPAPKPPAGPAPPPPGTPACAAGSRVPDADSKLSVRPSESLSIESALLPWAASTPSLSPSWSVSASSGVRARLLLLEVADPVGVAVQCREPAEPGGADRVRHLRHDRGRCPCASSCGVGQAVAVGVHRQRVRVADRRLVGVGQPVPVGVGLRRVRAEQLLELVDQPVPVGVGHRRRPAGVDRERVGRARDETRSGGAADVGQRREEVVRVDPLAALPHLEVQVVRGTGGVTGVPDAADHLPGVDVLAHLQVVRAAPGEVRVVVEAPVVALDADDVAAEPVREALHDRAPGDGVDRRALRGEDVDALVLAAARARGAERVGQLGALDGPDQRQRPARTRRTPGGRSRGSAAAAYGASLPG